MSENPPRMCSVSVVVQTRDGGMTSVRWDFSADDFDLIVDSMTATNGPPYFEQMWTKAELEQMARNHASDPMGFRWWPGGEPEGVTP